jgi:hypothetical protein
MYLTLIITRRIIIKKDDYNVLIIKIKLKKFDVKSENFD